MTVKYDIVAAGAGPAGATAAYILSKKGFSVLVVDKEHFPRKKLCGGCLTAKTTRILNDVFNESEDSLIKKNIINFKSNRFEIRYKTETIINKPSAYTFYFVDRSTYDNFLLQKVKEAGADVLEGVKITGVNAEKNELITSTGRLIKAKFIIAADGVNSTIRTKLYCQNKRNRSNWQRNLAYCLEIFPGREKYINAGDHPILDFGYLRYGCAWIFPNKDRRVIGMGGLGRKNKNLANQFNAYLADYNLDNIDALEIRGHPLPFGNFLLKPVWPGGNILLVGDAAGLVDPMLGEGIYQAHKSGELAARAIIENIENNKKTDANFLHLLHTHLFPELIYARKFRRLLYNKLNHIFKFRNIRLMDKHFDKLVEVAHGLRSYRWFKKKVDGIHTL